MIAVSLAMIPIGIVVEVAEWGSMPDRFVIAYLVGALFWGFIYHFTQPSIEAGFLPYEPDQPLPSQDP